MNQTLLGSFMNFKFIYKICNKSELLEAKNRKHYHGSEKDIKDGYIHFSEKDQLVETFKKYYSKKNNLVLLKVDTANLDHLIWEQASDGNMFPHLYSTLDMINVVDEFEVVLNEEGFHILPPNL